MTIEREAKMKKKWTTSIFLIIFIFMHTFAFAQTYQSPYAFLCPQIDGKCDELYWNKALSIDFPYGKLMIKNNYQYVYFLLDIVEDTFEDETLKHPFCHDYFELYVDWKGSGRLTRNFDRVYFACNSSGRLVYRYITDSNAFSGAYNSHGKSKAGFGPTFNSSTAHRYYEIKIPLNEIKIASNDFIRIGFAIYSKNPHISYQYPSNGISDMEKFHTVRLSFPPKNLELIYTLNSKVMKVNQEDFSMDVVPYIYGNRIFLPIRYVVEPFGGVFAWNSEDQRLVIFIQEDDIIMQVNSPRALLNGKEIKIDNDPSITPQWRPPGRVMVPLRFLAEAVGCRVFWDAKQQQATVRFTRK